jgi:Uma2 family endonuclease
VTPDVIVNCGEPRGAQTTLRTPAMVVEVISPSTGDHDKVDELEAYFTLADLKHVLLNEQAPMRVTAYARSAKGWLHQDHERADDVIALAELKQRIRGFIRDVAA